MTAVNSTENFTKVLHSRINAYFKTNGISRNMNGAMLFKIIFGAVWWIGSYVLLFIWDLPFWQFLLLYIFQGLSQIFLALAIAHDANHSAISNHPKVNKFFGYAFPSSRDDHEEYVRHVFATTSDYGLAKKAFTWYVGALNLHVIHHLVPDICHTHYPAFTKIIASTADEFNVSYRQNPSLRVAMISHYRLLKRLGSHDHLKSTVALT